ncbi:hypothetical protein JCM10213_007504 [Rhodosporidiobolus nylandii]
MHSNSLYLATLLAAASLAAATPSAPHGDLDRRDPFWRSAAVSAKPQKEGTPSASGNPSFKSVHKSKAAHSAGGEKDAKFWRSAAIKRQTVPLGSLADTAAPVLAALGSSSSSEPSFSSPNSADAADDSLPVNLAAIPSGSSSGSSSPLAGLPLPLARRADLLGSVLSTVAPLVNANDNNVSALNAVNSPLIAAPLVNQPAINVLSPGATTNQITAQNVAQNGSTIVTGDGNRVANVNGSKNTVNNGDTNQSVQGNNNKVSFGSTNGSGGATTAQNWEAPASTGSARGRSGGQRTVTRIGKTSSSSGSRGVTHRKAASRAKVAKAAASKAPSHSQSQHNVADAAEEDYNNSDCAAAPAVTKTRTRTLYKTVTRTVQAPTVTATPEQKHLLDLNIGATVNKVADAVAGLQVL